MDLVELDEVEVEDEEVAFLEERFDFACLWANLIRLWARFIDKKMSMYDGLDVLKNIFVIFVENLKYLGLSSVNLNYTYNLVLRVYKYTIYTYVYISVLRTTF